MAQDEVGHLAAQLVGGGNVRQPLPGLAAVVLQLEQVLEDREAALGARDAESVDEAEPVPPAGERGLQPRDVFGDDLGDDAVPVERRAVVTHEDFEAGQRRGDGVEIADGRIVGWDGHADISRAPEFCRVELNLAGQVRT